MKYLLLNLDNSLNNKLYNSEGTSYFYVNGKTILPDLKIEGDIGIILDSTSQLLCVGTSGHSGIEVPDSSSLRIYGVSNASGVNKGSIIAIGAENCAGIGGKNGESSGNIIMNSVHLLAVGGKDAAGIGGGNGGNGNGITINNSQIYALPSMKLEKALLCENQDEISNDYARLKGIKNVLTFDKGESDYFYSASIGGGNGGNGTNISAENTTLDILGSGYAAGIGGGYNGEADEITLKNCDLKCCNLSQDTLLGNTLYFHSLGGSYNDDNIFYFPGLYGSYPDQYNYNNPNKNWTLGSSIGGGFEKDGKNITIIGGDIKAFGCGNAAAIGGGEKGSGEDITISEGSSSYYTDVIYAYGTGTSAAIGGGKGGGAKNITIDIGNGFLSANGHTGIGAGLGGVADGITIISGSVYSTGKDGAGIGGGGVEESPIKRTVDAMNITINTESVNSSSTNGAAIGSGYGCCSENIHISARMCMLSSKGNDKFFIGSAKDAIGSSNNIYIPNKTVYFATDEIRATDYTFDESDCSELISEINNLKVVYDENEQDVSQILIFDRAKSYYDPVSETDVDVPCISYEDLASDEYGILLYYGAYLYLDGEITLSTSDAYLSRINIILADGAKIIINVEDDNFVDFEDTKIYGQENGTGVLEINYSDADYAIDTFDGETVINGGIVNINAEDSSEGYGINLPTEGKLTVNYGELNVNVANGNCIGTDSEGGLGTLEVNGGKVSLSTENGKAVALGGSQTMDGIFVDTNMYIFADESANPTIARCLNRTANQNISSNIAFQMKNVLIVSKNDDSAVFPALFSVVTDSATLLSALETVQDGETITLGSDMNLNDETVRVRAGQTLDLNGYNLDCETLMINGSIIDTSENKAVVTAKTFHMPESGDYLPIYNEEEGGYSFYAMKVNVYRNKTNPNKFGFRFDTSGNPGSEDYDLAKEIFGNTDESIENARIKAVVTFTWTDGGKEKKVPVSFDLSLIQSYLKKDNGILTITVNGLETIESDINVDFAFVALDKDGNEITSVKTPITIEKTVSEVSL